MPNKRKPVASITVPLRGDEDTRQALKILADELNVFVADITYDAICSIHGKRLREISQFLIASRVSQSDQKSTVMCEEPSA